MKLMQEFAGDDRTKKKSFTEVHNQLARMVVGKEKMEHALSKFPAIQLRAMGFIVE